MLDVVLLVLALACVGLGGTCIWLAGRQREFVRQFEFQAQRDALRDQAIKELKKRLDTYLTGSIRMGEELYELRRTVAPIPDKLSQIEQRDPSNLSFTQAARLVGLGASVDDLTQSCGLSRAEAELVSKLHQAKR
ncbi:DUF2802 domain-containing protein [Pseudomonas turukhanskensis]|jgi:hypothetical protein|uniref:Chemotaxis protein n=1 Tax=Pseudomonas turukhanskensis TaxID=1806536 RepID=A0A9W6KBH3_9PSED|nr:DUF2802 domain-containing protein [Pseudomonas turukhanskensis]GLK91559.1 hypothetical protein GCM10017655_46230 [Pseudomonas turukhanskensis]